MFSIVGSGLSAEIRIAILGDLEKNRAEIDSLTALLSKEPGVNLVERSEIDRILREQAIALGGLLANERAIKTGGLLGAQGVIIVKSFDWEGRRVLSARLVSTSSGLILDAWIQETPSKEPAHFSDAVKAKFIPLLPKLNLERKDIVALSLLSIRSPVDTPEGRELERKVTLLLSQRLMMEKSFVVLERWRLNNLAWEKELGLDESKLTTGNYALDGSVESFKDGSGTVKVSLRLRKPGAEVPETINASGSALELKSLVSKLASEIDARINSTALRTDTVQVRWDSSREAELYAKEAAWLLLAHAYERAREAAEAAVTLGASGPELDFIRIKSYYFESGAEKIDGSAELDPAKLAAALDAYVKFVESGPVSLPGKFDREKDWRSLGTKLISAVANSISRRNPPAKEKELLDPLRSLAQRAAQLTMEKGDGAWTIMGFYAVYSQNIQTLFGKGPAAENELKKLLARNFAEHPQLRRTIRSALANSGQDWTFYAVQLRQSKERQDQIDAILLSRDCAAEETAIEKIIWEERDAILDGEDAKGLCTGALASKLSAKSHAVISAKLLRYASSRDVPFDAMNFFMSFMVWAPDELPGEEVEAIRKELPLFKKKMWPLVRQNRWWDGGLVNMINSIKDKSGEAVDTADKSTIPQIGCEVLFDSNSSPQNKKLSGFTHIEWMDGLVGISCSESGKEVLILIDPKSGASERYEHPRGHGLMRFGEGKVFATDGGNEGRIFWTDKGSSEWKELVKLDFQSPISGFSIAGGKLYASFGSTGIQSNSGIVQIDAQSGEMRLVAGNRRNPPLTPLDNCPGYKIRNFDASPAGTIMIELVTNGHNFIYKVDLNTNKWEELFKSGDVTNYLTDSRYKGGMYYTSRTNMIFSHRPDGSVEAKDATYLVTDNWKVGSGFSTASRSAICENSAGIMSFGKCTVPGVYSVCGTLGGERFAGFFSINNKRGTLNEFSVASWFGIDEDSVIEAFRAKEGSICIAKFPLVKLKTAILSRTKGWVTIQVDQNRGKTYMKCSDSKAVIHYTLDGSEPDGNSPVYKDPFEVADETLIKARASLEDGSLGLTASVSARLFPELEATLESREGLRPGALCVACKGVWSRTAGDDFWEDWPDFKKLVPVFSGVVKEIEMPVCKIDEGAAYKFDFILDVKTAGLYRFEMGGDRLRPVLSVDGLPLSTPTQEVQGPDGSLGAAFLKEGLHRVEFVITTNNPADKNILKCRRPGSKGYESLPPELLFHEAP
ncbi:MAG: FN3 associated domain-containing protein [Victivallales bacterium]